MLCISCLNFLPFTFHWYLHCCNQNVHSVSTCQSPDMLWGSYMSLLSLFSSFFLFFVFSTITLVITLDFDCHAVPLPTSYHQFRLLIGLYSIAQIWYLIRKRNENDKNKFFDKNKKKCQKRKYKHKVEFFTLNSPHWPVM